MTLFRHFVPEDDGTQHGITWRHSVRGGTENWVRLELRDDRIRAIEGEWDDIRRFYTSDQH